MNIPQNAHIAIVDGERFMLLRNTGSASEPKLEKLDEPDLDATNFSAGVKHQDDAGQRTGNTDLNELAHGTAAAEWLNQGAKSGKIKDLVVVADPKTLGEMRRHYHKELQSCLVGEVAKTLGGESLEQIEKTLAKA